MRLGRDSSKGFTLLEILIVLVIIAVLAGLAVPAYSTAVEKSRAQEALAMLSNVRAAMTREHAKSGTYANATFTANQEGTLDFIPPTASGVQADGQETLFTYEIEAGADADSYSIKATRVSKTGAPEPAGGPHEISISESGAITKTGIYAT